jgi:hypothetical protein
LLKKSAKGAVFDDFWEVSQKSDRKPPLKTLAFWTRCGVYAPFERAKKSYFNNLLGVNSNQHGLPKSDSSGKGRARED